MTSHKLTLDIFRRRSFYSDAQDNISSEQVNFLLTSLLFRRVLISSFQNMYFKVFPSNMVCLYGHIVMSNFKMCWRKAL